VPRCTSPAGSKAARNLSRVIRTPARRGRRRISSPIAIRTPTCELTVQVPPKSSVTLPTPPSKSSRSQRLLPSPSTVRSAAPALSVPERQRVPLGCENLTTAWLAPVWSRHASTRRPPSSMSASVAPRVRSRSRSTLGENVTLADCRSWSRETTRSPPSPAASRPSATALREASKLLMGRNRRPS
jgi:hypothetical protein